MVDLESMSQCNECNRNGVMAQCFNELTCGGVDELGPPGLTTAYTTYRYPNTHYKLGVCYVSPTRCCFLLELSSNFVFFFHKKEKHIE